MKTTPTIEQRLAELRQRIAAHQQERTTLTNQKRSRGEVQACMQRAAEGWREAGERTLRQQAREIAGGEAPQMLAEFVGINDRVSIGSALALVLGADAVATALQKYTEHIPEGLDKPAREARLAEIGAELDALEAEEERLIEEAEAAGEYIERRPDARPEIILGAIKPPPIRLHPTLYQGRNPPKDAPRTAASPYLGSSRP